NAHRFLQIVKPELAVFVKYEYWYHHLSGLSARGIPVLLVSALFRADAVFFKWYGGFYRKILFLFRQLFVQDEASLQRLTNAGIGHASVGGDTRFDRVSRIASEAQDLPLIRGFAQSGPLLVAGSTWPDDDRMLAEAVAGKDLRLIIAPHEITPAHLQLLSTLFPRSVRYSELEGGKNAESGVLVIDNIGMLSRLYRYGSIAYIGGGFNKSGIHNTLEAAVWGKPVLFGPNYSKFREARELIGRGAAFSMATAGELREKLEELMGDVQIMETAGAAAGDYVRSNTGATERIMNYIQANRLLTR
ncbi:MAG TPA: glycosyltransferase N-terminal domain-containing protein, partial [Anseongella sp.]|nr:glycosyltransferase N-terminal domain-containing protein [Anseongella sp.]